MIKACIAIEDAAGEIQHSAGTSLHHAFAEHLMKVATALYQYGRLSDGAPPGTEEAAIRSCLPVDSELRQAIADAIRVRDELTRVIGGMTK